MASPEGFIPPTTIRKFAHAAAGHEEGVLSDESGALLIKPCLPKEIAFYESAVLHPEFAKWMPTFMGTLQMGDTTTSVLGNEASGLPIPTVLPAPQPTGTDVGDRIAAGAAEAKRQKKGYESSIVLSNLTYGFTRPCVMDVKLGAKLWDDDASLEKRAKLDAVAAKSTSKALGLRIAGMNVWNGQEYHVYNKVYGRTFTAETVVEGFREYLTGEISDNQQVLLAKRFIEKLEKIQDVMEAQESRMYSASLLFIYEGDKDALEDAIQAEALARPKNEDDDEYDSDEDEDEEDENVNKVEELKLIDFAHAAWTPGLGTDENALQGVRNCAALFRKLHKGA